MDFIWKFFRIKKGVYVEELDKSFEELPKNKSLYLFLYSFIRLGDRVRYQWQFRKLSAYLFLKLKGYDIKISSTKNTITIKMKKKTEKQLVSQIVSEAI